MNNQNQSGKGSKFRPVNKKTYNKNYDDIFRKSKPKKNKELESRINAYKE